MKPSRPVLLGLAFALLFAAPGCKKAERAVHPVRGRVLLQGAPIAECRVIFYPVDAPDDVERPEGYTDANGWFEVSARRDEKGAAEGSYKVVLIWRDRETNPNSEDYWKGPNKLPAKYGVPAHTDLRADVKPGANELAPFDVRPTP